MPLVWTEIAQIIYGANGFYECSNGGGWYGRTDRQPPKDHNNYCARCREGNRGLARQSNRRQCALQREVQQLDAVGGLKWITTGGSTRAGY
ncbi:MAG TPA: hypothetical protein VI542_15650 [Candidatus Tectomicrobia bacterium]